MTAPTTAAPFGGRRTRNFRQVHTDGICVQDAGGYCPCPVEDAAPDVAELVCSDVGPVKIDPFVDEVVEGHKPVIDLDMPCSLVPSGTPGHFHLYIEQAVTFEAYMAILKAMADAGIVQWGFHDRTRERGFGSVRHPDRPKK